MLWLLTAIPNIPGHTEVHNSSRPLHCLDIGCLQGEDDKGFKRKNDLTQHGHIYNSPSYQCAFYPDPVP